MAMCIHVAEPAQTLNSNSVATKGHRLINRHFPGNDLIGAPR